MGRKLRLIGMVCWFSMSFWVVFIQKPLAQGQAVPESILRKDGAKMLEQRDYQSAAGVYKDLVGSFPDNPEYNMNYGMCLLYTDSVKSSCLKYLYFAATPPQPDPMAYYYLGVAYHLNYKLEDAIEYYEKFKTATEKKPMPGIDIELRILMCRNAKELMKNPVETEIVSRKSISNSFYTSAYGVLLVDASISFVPPPLQSKTDLKEGSKSTMCTYNNENEMIYSSYGASLKNGKELYRKLKLGQNEWSKSSLLDEKINSPADENFPFVVAEGRILYFSSNGAGSMGGYDIFRSEWNEVTQSWGTPRNLGYPINSVFDDVLFVPKPEEQIAYMASDRSSPAGRIEVFSIKYPKETVSTAVIKGFFEPPVGEDKQPAQITVIDIGEDELVGIYNTNRKTNSYLIALTPGAKYKFTVKVKGFQEQSVILDLPKMEKWFTLKQILKLDRNANVETLRVYNFFTEAEAGQFEDWPSPELLKTHKNAAVNQVTLSDESGAAGGEEYAKLAKDEMGRTVKRKMSPEEIRKQSLADNFYELKDYDSARKLYFELLSVYPRDVDYNLKMGISLFYTSKDKAVAVPYLKAAAEAVNPNPDAYYYLGRCFHLAASYELSIDYFNKYKNVVSLAEIEKNNITRLMEYCEYGRQVKPRGAGEAFEIINQKTTSADWLYSALNGYEFFGKIIKTLDDFKSKWDVKRNFESTMYLARDNNTLYYASYGENKENSLDIYRRVRLFSGEWSPPQYLDGINTVYDENYPFYTSDGVLYFSSNRKDSYGGYDVFMSRASPDLQSWSVPVNMGTPVNSPAEDVYFILNKDGESGYVSSDREAVAGQMNIYNIRKKR